ncbi:MAG: tetratricopeptide repeat protein [Polyangia bacterium]
MRVSLLLIVIALWVRPADAGQEPGTAAPAPPAAPSSAISAPPLPGVPGPLPDPIAPSPDERREEARLCTAWITERRLALAYALRPDAAVRAELPLVEPYPVKQEVERGHALFQTGQFEAAAEAYATLYAARPQLVRVLFNVAQAFRRARKEREALAFYRRYLRAEPDGPLRQEVQGYVGELSALLAARALSQSAPRPSPVYRRPWFWVLLGGATVGLVTAVAVGVTLGSQKPPEQPVLGPFVVTFPQGGM